MQVKNQVTNIFQILYHVIQILVVFRINGRKKYIDKNGRTYVDFQDYKEKNTLNRAATLGPVNGTYIVAEENNNGRVPLELGETPSCDLSQRIKTIGDTVVMVGGIVLSVTGVVTFFAPALFSARAMAVIQAGSFFLTGHSVVG